MQSFCTPTPPPPSAGGFGEIRNDNDANLTYEGDNNLRIQQLSNFLLRLERLPLEGTPLHSADFLLQRGEEGRERESWPEGEEVATVECESGDGLRWSIVEGVMRLMRVCEMVGKDQALAYYALLVVVT